MYTQRVEVPGAAHLELDGILAPLDPHGAGILPPRCEKEVLDLMDLLRLYENKRNKRPKLAANHSIGNKLGYLTSVPWFHFRNAISSNILLSHQYKKKKRCEAATFNITSYYQTSIENLSSNPQLNPLYFSRNHQLWWHFKLLKLARSTPS